MRGRKPLGLTAAIGLTAVLLALVAFGVLAWRAGGPQPLKDVAVPLAVPGASK